MRRLMLVAALSAWTGVVSADEIWHGWMNLTPCSRIVWKNEAFGFLHLPSATLESGPQELHGYLNVNLPTEQSILQVARKCAEKGVVAAGIAAVLTNWAGAYPAFQAAWSGCIAEAPTQISASAINFRTETICRW